MAAQHITKLWWEVLCQNTWNKVKDYINGRYYLSNYKDILKAVLKKAEFSGIYVKVWVFLIKHCLNFDMLVDSHKIVGNISETLCILYSVSPWVDSSGCHKKI